MTSDPGEYFFSTNEADVAACVTSGLSSSDPIQCGMNRTVGHVDFWPDGGTRDHASCAEERLGDTFPEYFLGVNCEHSFAWHYWVATLANSCHKAVACDSYENFVGGKCNDQDR